MGGCQQYYQAEQICSIGSGAIESTVKQIDEVNAAFGACIRKNVDRRTKISGAQWKIENQIIIYLIPTTYYPTPISYF